MDENGWTMFIGFLIVLIVGVNIVLFFGDLFHIGGSSSITGFATATSCKNIVGGISCSDGSQFGLKPISGNCAPDLTQVCTNACQIEKAKVGDNRVCPDYCADFCLPAAIAKKL